jgi:hypothetical protein
MSWATFYCVTCRDEPGDQCGDECECAVADVLPPIFEDLPLCACCGRTMSVGEVLAPVAG